MLSYLVNKLTKYNYVFYLVRRGGVNVILILNKDKDEIFDNTFN